MACLTREAYDQSLLQTEEAQKAGEATKVRKAQKAREAQKAKAAAATRFVLSSWPIGHASDLQA